MKPETGIPEWDGLYVVYVEGAGGALEPFMTVWQDGAWRYRRSTAKFDGTIYGWIGPLPDMQKPGKPKVISGDIKWTPEELERIRLEAKKPLVFNKIEFDL